VFIDEKKYKDKESKKKIDYIIIKSVSKLEEINKCINNIMGNIFFSFNYFLIKLFYIYESIS